MPESAEKTETGSVDMNQLTLLKTVDARRRKLKIRRLKYTFQTKSTPVAASYEVDGQKFYGEAETNGGVCSREICLSLTSSARVDEHSSTKKEVVLSGFKDNVDEMIKNNKRGSFQSFGRVSYGSVSVIGRRREMEDAVRVQLGFFSSSSSSSSSSSEGEEEGEKYDFFGVYDGHGGARVAEACSEGLHRVLAEEMMNNYYKEGINKGEIKGMEYWGRVMEGCFERMDKQVLKDRMMGSTAVVAVVGKEELVVANCGDSRAVLCRAGVAVPLSVDHKPDRADELERVEAAGGRVINWDGQRVLGVLSTSRSIGDEYLKPFVVCKPEVTVSKRSENDEFIILATDGLWDVISNEVACHVGRRCLSGRTRRKKYPRMMSDSHAAEAAAVLAELATARGSKDNISVIVVDLKKRSDFCSF